MWQTPSSPDGEPFKLSGVLLADRLHVIDPGQGRTTATELDHSPNRHLVTLKDGLHTAVREVPDPSGDSFGPGLILHGPPEPDTLHQSADPHTHPHCHVHGFGGGGLIDTGQGCTAGEGHYGARSRA